MILSDLTLQKPLEDYIELYEKAAERSLMLFEPLLDEAFVFEDPYQKSLGLGGFRALMAGRYSLYKSSSKDKSALRYRVHDFAWGRREGVAYMYWSMLLPAFSFEGMSELVLSKCGRVMSHRDFWSAHDGFDVKRYKGFKL